MMFKQNESVGLVSVRRWKSGWMWNKFFYSDASFWFLELVSTLLITGKLDLFESRSVTAFISPNQLFPSHFVIVIEMRSSWTVLSFIFIFLCNYHFDKINKMANKYKSYLKINRVFGFYIYCDDNLNRAIVYVWLFLKHVIYQS
jgi:hypothetical protein